MSKVAIIGNAAGAGVFTIASPNSNTDRTLTMPNTSGTIETFQTISLFSASASSQAMAANGGSTKIASFGTPEIDNKSWWSAANQRYTPQVAGWYAVNASFTAVSTTASIPLSAVLIYRNGAAVGSFFARSTNQSNVQADISRIVYANGSTDYIELWGRNYTNTVPTGAGLMQIYLVQRDSA